MWTHTSTSGSFPRRGETESAINQARREVDRGLTTKPSPSTKPASAPTPKARDEASHRAYYSTLARLGDTNTALTEGLSALTLLQGPVKSKRLVVELHPVRTVADKAHSDHAQQFSRQFDQLVNA